MSKVNSESVAREIIEKLHHLGLFDAEVFDHPAFDSANAVALIAPFCARCTSRGNVESGRTGNHGS